MDVSTRATGKAVGLTRSMYTAGTRRWSRLAFGLCYCFQIYSITIPAAGSSARYPLDQGDPEPAVAARWRAEPKQATQSVRARIWSTVAAVTKLPSTRICHPPPSARNTAVRPHDSKSISPKSKCNLERASSNSEKTPAVSLRGRSPEPAVIIDYNFAQSALERFQHLDPVSPTSKSLGHCAR